MLNTIVYISGKHNNFTDEALTKNDESIYLSFLVNVDDKKSLAGAYQFFSGAKVPFSLSLVIKSMVDDATMLEIISFFFIPAYTKININLLCHQADMLSDFQKKIINASHKQGFKNLTINVIDYQNNIAIGQPGTYPIFNTVESLAHSFSTINAAPAFTKLVFVHTEDKQEFEKIYLYIKQQEDKFKTDNPDLYNLAIRYKNLSIEKEYLSSKVSVLSTELNTYKSNMEILKSSHEAVILQGYYHNEYEILPLWYKRFGQLLKVLLGKRSFKSLFNDNVKKYKD